jgi:N-carbamoyl-L-amino-acid hydrolase
VNINPDRLLSDLRTLASFGRYETGVHRPTYSADDMAARRWFAQRIEEAGQHAEIDGIGNVYGFDPTKSRLALAGSHLESQNHAGWLDGALGVIYALEAARAISETPGNADAGLDVVAFADAITAVFWEAAPSSVI